MRNRVLWLTIAFVFTIPWEAALEIEQFGRFSKILGIVASVAWAASVVARGRIRRLDPFVWAYFVFLIWNGLTLFWSIKPATSVSGFITYVQLFGMILILWDLFETEGRIGAALQAFVLGAYISAASLIVTWVTAPPTRFPEHQRINALGFETDGIALIVALAIPAAWYLAAGRAATGRAVWLRVINFLYVPLAAFAIVLTGTRGAAIASIPSLVFILWSAHAGGYTRKAVAWMLAAAAVVALILFAPAEPLQRITGAGQDVVSGDSLSGRRDIWAEGVVTFYENPIVGTGLDTFRVTSSFDKEAHNTPLSILVETGIVGFVILGYGVLTVLTRTVRLRGWAAWYWNTQLAVVMLGSLTLSLEDAKPVWLFFTLAVASISAHQEQKRDRTDSTAATRPPVITTTR